MNVYYTSLKEEKVPFIAVDLENVNIVVNINKKLLHLVGI